MKQNILTLAVLVVALFVSAPGAFGQGAAKTGPDPSLVRDAELEKDSNHDLEVARHYFKLKKAYVAALRRCEIIDASNPTFAKMDEVLFIAGQTSMLLADNKGKQKSTKTPEQLRLDARVYLSRLVAGYPNSIFFKQAETDLQALGGPITPEPSKQ
jgi:outer membrane protein assembly factor BamD (BamD/ComL family)